MWEFFDPEVRQKLSLLKHLTVLRRQTPLKEWPLLADGNTLFVVREWPNGDVTAYLVTRE